MAKPKKYKFAVVSDTHIGSKESRLDLLHDFYKWAKKKGADIIIHSGDIIDGVGVYKGQLEHLEDPTINDQVKRVIKEYPDNFITYYILGNHDLKHAKKHSVPTPGSMISNGFDIIEYKNGQPIKKHINGRKDLIYLGDFYARMELPYNIVVDVIHPSGFYYSKSYGIQKYFRDQPMGNLPHIALFGHRHQALFMQQNGVYAFEDGCFKDADEYILRRGLYPYLGGWLLEIRKYSDGSIDLTPTWRGYNNNPVTAVIKVSRDEGRKTKRKRH